jgi:hypothetical protein
VGKAEAETTTEEKKNRNRKEGKTLLFLVSEKAVPHVPQG